MRNTRAYNTRKGTDKKISEGAEYNCKDISSQTRIFQLEMSTMIISQLDTCHCDSMKLIKKTIAQINRFEFREDITDTKKLIEKTWNEKYKSRNDLFWRFHCIKRLEESYSSDLLEENLCIARKFLPNYKRTGKCQVTVQKLRYKRNSIYKRN